MIKIQQTSQNIISKIYYLLIFVLFDNFSWMKIGFILIKYVEKKNTAGYPPGYPPGYISYPVYAG